MQQITKNNHYLTVEYNFNTFKTAFVKLSDIHSCLSILILVHFLDL